MNQPAARTSPVQRTLLLFGSVVLTLLLLELAVRSYDGVRGIGFFSATRNELARSIRGVRPFRGFGPDLYEERGGVLLISSRHGELYPLRKPPGTIRIVVFGGSTTENQHAFESAGIDFPKLIEDALKARTARPVEVINVGNSAYATPHSLILLALDVVSWEPDLVLLSHNINDRTAMSWPEFRPDYSNKYADPFFGVPNYGAGYTLLNIMFQHSQLYWALMRRVQRRQRRNAEPIRRRLYGTVPAAWAVEVFERNLRSFVTLATERGIRVVLGTQPMEPSEESFCREMCAKPYNDVVVYPLHEEWLAHHRYYNQIIAMVAAESGVGYVDNQPVFEGREDLFIDHVHYTVGGVELLAQNYTQFLIEQSFIAFQGEDGVVK